MSVLDSYMKDLAELVNKDRGTANIAGVTEAAKIMKGHLESIGFKADLVDLGPNAGNGLFATNKPNADRYDVLFNAHLDTVFPDGTAAARPLTVKGDRAYGPGCSDCKSGVLAIYYTWCCKSIIYIFKHLIDTIADSTEIDGAVGCVGARSNHCIGSICCIGHVKCELAVGHRTIGKRLRRLDAHITVSAQLACCLVGVGEWNNSRRIIGRIVVIVNVTLVIASTIGHHRGYLDAA